MKHVMAKDYNVSPKEIGIDFNRDGMLWASVVYTIEKESVQHS